MFDPNRQFSQRFMKTAVPSTSRPYRFLEGGGKRLAPAVLGLPLLLLSGSLQAQAAAPQAEPPEKPIVVKPPPVPTGVIPLPQGAPPTGLQSPLPSPARALPNAEDPLLVSPDIAAISSYLQNRTLTIDDAVSVALYANRAYASAVSALLRARARTGQARTLLNPTLGVNADLTEFDAPTVADFSALGGGNTGTGSGSTASPPPLVIVPQFNPVITTAATLPLDVSGSIRAAVSQAQFNEVASRIDVNRVRNQLVFDVRNAFYNALRAQAQVAVATDTLNNALARLDDANKNYRAGTAPRFDVISAQRDVADAQRALLDSQAQVRLALAALKNTMGVSLASRLRLTQNGAVEDPPGVAPPTVAPIGPDGRPVAPAQTTSVPANDIPAAAPPPAQPATAPDITPNGKTVRIPTPPVDVVDDDTPDLGPEYNAALQEGLRTRPEILEGDAQISAARRGVQYARRSSLPSLSLSLSYTYTPNATGFTRTNQGAATLGVSIPIFDGGLARERVREARADIATAETNRRQAVDQVSLDVQQAYINLAQTRSRVAVANVGLSEAREAYRLSRLRYNTGVSQQPGISPQLELSQAQAALTAAQTAQVNALYDYNQARSQLDRAVGRYSYTASGPGYAVPPSPKTLGTGK